MKTGRKLAVFSLGVSMLRCLLAAHKGGVHGVTPAPPPPTPTGTEEHPSVRIQDGPAGVNKST